MRKKATFILIALFLTQFKADAKKIIDPICQIQIDEYQYDMLADNPKGKLKIRFVRNEDKSADSTNKPKSFFGKLKSVVNMLLDVSDNPPFKVEIVREKAKKN